MISTRHLITADKKSEGVHHPDCLKLAELASTAVDFPKTGRKVGSVPGARPKIKRALN